MNLSRYVLTKSISVLCLFLAIFSINLVNSTVLADKLFVPSTTAPGQYKRGSSLVFQSCRIALSDLESLTEGTDKLRSIEISNSSLEPGVWRKLLVEVKPTSITLVDSLIPDIDWPLDSTLLHLEFLHIHGKKLFDSDMPDFSKYPGLKTVDLEGTSISGSCLKGLAESRVAYLLLSDTLVTDTNLSCLRGIKTLRVLALNNCSISGLGLTGLSPALEEIQLNNTKLSVDGLNIIGNTFHEITSLRIVDSLPSSRSRMRFIENLSRLEKLDFGASTLYKEDLRSMVRLNKLRRLSLQKCTMRDAILRSLAEVAIEQLELVRCSGLASSARTLKKFKTLKMLLLSDCDLSIEEVSNLRKLMPSCQVLVERKEENG